MENYSLRTRWATITQLLAVKIAWMANAASKGLFGKEMEDLFEKFTHGHETRGAKTTFRLRNQRDIGYSSFSHVGPSTLNALAEYYPLSGKAYRKTVLRHIYDNNLAAGSHVKL